MQGPALKQRHIKMYFNTVDLGFPSMPTVRRQHLRDRDLMIVMLCVFFLTVALSS